MVGQWHEEGYAWIPRLDFAVNGNWHAGGNGWKPGSMQWLALGMKESMVGFEDWTCTVVGNGHEGGNGWKFGFVV